MALPNHATQTDPYLHEPKGVSTASSGEVYIADGLGSGAWGDVGLVAGSVIGSSSTLATSVITGSTVMPFDNTIPQNTEGVECITGSITPSSEFSVIDVDVSLISSLSVTGHVSVALFQGGVTGAVAASSSVIGFANSVCTIPLSYEMVAGTTSALTFSVRAGGSTAGTITINGSGGTGLFGGVATSVLRIKEIKV